MQEENQKEFLVIQVTAEELLGRIARAEVEVNEHTISRLYKLSTAGAKLAYGGDCLELESDQMHNLIAWCDHLFESGWEDDFIKALQKNPLCSPWKIHA